MTTTPDSQAGTHSPHSARHGCLKGCLIVAIVIVLFLVAGTVLALTAGRAYVARHLPEWEARYPLLGVGVELLSLRDALTAQGSNAADGRQAGSNDRSLLPSDVAVHPSPEVETYNIAPDQVTAFQRVAVPSNEVLGQLRHAWTDNGWSLHDEREIGGAPSLVWQKGDRVCRMEVLAIGRGAEVWLRCSTTGQ